MPYGLPPDHSVAENLRRLTSHFLHHPDSQIILVHIEPGAAGRCKIIVSLEMVDFFPGVGVLYDPPPDHPAAENLRRLASRFLHHPDSQIILVHIEPDAAGRFRITISFEMVDFP